jgi:hypothetical protein
MLSWLVEEEGIAPHIRVNDKSKRRMAASRAATFDMIRQTTFSPADKTLTTTGLRKETLLFDHLVGGDKQRLWGGQTRLRVTSYIGWRSRIGKLRL